MTGKWKIILASAAACTGITLSACSWTGKPIRIGTAGEGGNYYTFGLDFAEILSSANEDLKFEIKETAGSAANLRLLTGKYIQLALAQTDVIHDAWTGTGPFEGNNIQRGYGAVAGLYKEACQVIVAEDSDIESIRDLRGKKVSIGERESGTVQNAEQILQAYGMNDRMLKMVNMNYSEAVDALKEGEIDAFFCTAGVRTAIVEELARQYPVRLLPIDSVEQENLQASYDYYIPYVIPAQTYTGQAEDIETVAVQSVLLASNTLKADTVRRITQTLFEHAEEFRTMLPVDCEISPENAVLGIPIPFHKGAEEYYASAGISIASEKEE